MKLYDATTAAWAEHQKYRDSYDPSKPEDCARENELARKAFDREGELAAALQPIMDQFHDGLINASEMLAKMVVAADGEPTL